ncbi:substrate-binding domain-containing protein [Sphingomonas sp. AR_OL41]|uniref:PstS family phosphate ABC transporter substrate-binding protein n=1 Tax=Sphingomonas sp. AR_OL41 TaxID=3042729 RepID=UPI0024813A20|nr:substrate-binding domain-containing protein [Sphingomonas sp. AR_OL41]MDH7974469.1 substrate-binding domain-containing protein [Sphingomonas sp. AR_OL41]
MRHTTLALAVSLSVGAAPAPQVIRIVGYNDMREMLAAAAPRIEARHPNVRIVLDLPATRAAPAALIDGSSVLAPMGAAMDPADRAALRARWGGDPLEIRVAHDSLSAAALSSPIGVIVARDNPLTSLPLATIRAAFTGTAPPARWGDLGVRGAWAAQPVHLYGLASDTAIARYLLQGPFAATGFTATVRTSRQSRDVATAVANDRFGLGITSLNRAGGATRALALSDAAGTHRPDRAGIRSGHYPFDRFLLVYARRDRRGGIEPEAAMLLDFLLSRAGQAIIAHGTLGYLPLNRHELATERARLGVSR